MFKPIEFKPIEIQGIWFLPHKPEFKIPGILKYIPNKEIKLNLMGSFQNIDSEGYDRDFRADLILGYTNEAQKITLYVCNESNSYANSELGFLSSSFDVSYLFAGFHFNSPEELRFHTFSANYHLLHEWLHITGIEIEENLKEQSLNVNYTQPNINRFALDIGTCEFDFIYETSGNNWAKKEFSIKQKSFVRFKFNEELSFKEIFEYIIRFQYFLVLGTGSEIFPIHINVVGNTKAENIIDNLLPINLIFAWEHIMSDSSDKHVSKMPFPFFKIKNEFEITLNNWFNKYNDLLPVLNLFFEHEYKQLIFNENTFMNYIQALETFHRRVSSNTIIPIEEHKKKIDNIVESVPSEYKEWLAGKLKYSHEPSLSQRLDLLIEQYPSPVFNHLIQNKKKKFIYKSVDNRNYYTHYDKSLEGKVLPLGQLYKLTLAIKSLLLTCILIEIGFNQENTDDLVAKKFNIRLVRKKKED